jgi:hypothetical protein
MVVHTRTWNPAWYDIFLSFVHVGKQGTRWLVGAEITAPAAFNLHGGTNLPYVSISQAEKGYFIQFTSGMEKRYAIQCAH